MQLSQTLKQRWQKQLSLELYLKEGLFVIKSQYAIVIFLVWAVFIYGPAAVMAADDVVQDDAMAHIKPAAKPYAKSYVGDMITKKAAYEDTLIDIARVNNLGFVEMRAANPNLDPWIPGEGATIVIPARHLLPDADKSGIVINLPEMRLFFFPADGSEPVTHPIGVGRIGLETPTGSTQVMRKKVGPTWYPTQRMRDEDPSLPEYIKPGSNNPLGTHALYLGWPSYALHGTNKPYGIGRRVSSGCIRLLPEDIVTLFDKVEVGTKVEVVNQPVKAGWIDDVLYVEAHPNLEQSNAMEENGGMPSYELSKDELALVLKVAGEYQSLINWEQLREVVRRRQGYPVAIALRESKEEI